MLWKVPYRSILRVFSPNVKRGLEKQPNHIISQGKPGQARKFGGKFYSLINACNKSLYFVTPLILFSGTNILNSIEKLLQSENEIIKRFALADEILDVSIIAWVPLNVNIIVPIVVSESALEFIFNILFKSVGRTVWAVR